MKEFCKNHKKELFFVILYFAFVYVACFFLYISYHSRTGPFYHDNMGAYPWILYIKPRWKIYVEDIMKYSIWYLQGFFLILAWISLINQKKWLYGLFTLMIWGNFYFVFIKYFHFERWLFKWWIYDIVPVASLILPLLYVLRKKNQGMFWISNLTVFSTACRWEINEIRVMLESTYKAKINMFALIAYVLRSTINSFCPDLYNFLQNPVFSKIFNYLNIDLESVWNSMMTIKRYNTELLELIYIIFLREKAEHCVWIDYYWFFRVFILTGIFMLGILLSYQKRSKENIADKRK